MSHRNIFDQSSSKPQAGHFIQQVGNAISDEKKFAAFIKSIPPDQLNTLVLSSILKAPTGDLNFFTAICALNMLFNFKESTLDVLMQRLNPNTIHIMMMTEINGKTTIATLVELELENQAQNKLHYVPKRSHEWLLKSIFEKAGASNSKLWLTLLCGNKSLGDVLSSSSLKALIPNSTANTSDSLGQFKASGKNELTEQQLFAQKVMAGVSAAAKKG